MPGNPPTSDTTPFPLFSEEIKDIRSKIHFANPSRKEKKEIEEISDATIANSNQFVHSEDVHNVTLAIHNKGYKDCPTLRCISMLYF